MPSSLPFWYYRTDTTNKAILPDPSSLPANQKLIFEGVDQEVAEEYRIHHKNRIAAGTIPQPDGSSVTRHEHIGREFNRRTVKGYIRDVNEELKLLAFANASQQQGVHEFGRFGLFHPTRTVLNVDPDNVAGVGLIFDELIMEHKTEQGSVTFFEATVLIDGTFVTPLP